MKLRTQDLSRVFRSGGAELVVFSGLHLEVEPGERLAIIGESGSGKSTLLHLLGGLDRPSSGAIYYDAKDITTLGDAELAVFRNRTVGFVWQIHYLLPEFTALENVMMPLLIRGVEKGEAERAAREALAETGLAARATHRAGELSGGEQQRVALSRALAAKPSVLLLDEPTGNLDHRTAGMVFSLLEDLHRAHRFSMIFVTHNHSFAGRCDRILKMEGGVLLPASAPLAEGRLGV